MSDGHGKLLDNRRIAVIGAGPIGLEAALYGVALGAEVRIYESGRVAQHVGEWGHVRLFTPFEMNHSPLGRTVLESKGRRLPKNDAVQTGAEWRDSYLLPLAEHTSLADGLALGSRVVTVGKRGMFKGDHVGNGQRSGESFRLLIETEAGERYGEADVVLDCSGTWGKPNWMGQGGVPAIGERESRRRIVYHPVDVAGSHRSRFAHRRTLLIGDGLSAATTALALTELVAEALDTQAVWATAPAASPPIRPVKDDPLVRRAELVRAANEVAVAPASGLEWLPGSTVRSIRWDGSRFRVMLDTPEGEREGEYDEVIANVGYEPDNSLYEELQVHECYASRGPMKLAATLLAATADSGDDCLKLGGFGPEVLVNPEPNFFILGMKSYGRNSSFLLQTGFEQIRDVFTLLTNEPELDLYAEHTTRSQHDPLVTDY
jgi:thioredoxin reductase